MNLNHWDLMAKYFSSNTNREEEKKLYAWIKENPANEKLFAQSQKYWNAFGKVKEFDPDTEKAWEKLKGNILSNKPHRKIYSINRNRRKIKYMTIAASLVLIIVLGYLLMPKSIETKQVAETIIKADDKINIFYLPDSSLIWLNKNSTLKYAEDFNENRIVQLEGEAFFEVKKKDGIPFIIQTSITTTQVLGTAFDLKAYKSDKDVQIVVASGTVEFSSNKSRNEKVILNRNEKGIATNEGQITKEENKDVGFLAWMNNKDEVKKTKVFKNEQSHPGSYLLIDYKWKDNLIKQTMVEGEIYNSAIFTSYNKVELKVTYFDINKKEKAVNYFTVNKPIRPGASVKYKYGLNNWFEGTKSVGVEILDARVSE